VRETWLRRNGQLRFDDISDLDGSESWLRCEANVCDYAGRVRVVLSETPAECNGPELAVIPRAIAATCPRGAIDQADLAARGAHAIYLNDGAIEIVDASSVIGERPWAPPRLSVNDAGADQ
jgi:hypothetical protein